MCGSGCGSPCPPHFGWSSYVSQLLQRQGVGVGSQAEPKGLLFPLLLRRSGYLKRINGKSCYRKMQDLPLSLGFISIFGLLTLCCVKGPGEVHQWGKTKTSVKNCCYFKYNSDDTSR